MEKLPIEIWELIASNAQCLDVKNLRKTCKYLYNNLDGKLYDRHSIMCPRRNLPIEKVLKRRMNSIVKVESFQNNDFFTLTENISQRIKLQLKWRRFQPLDDRWAECNHDFRLQKKTRWGWENWWDKWNDRYR